MAFDLQANGISFYGAGFGSQIVADVDFPSPLGPDGALRYIEDAARNYVQFKLDATAQWQPPGNSAGLDPSGPLAAANSVLGFTGTLNLNPINDVGVALTRGTQALKSGGSAIGAGAYSAWKEARDTVGSANEGLRKDIGAAVPVVVAVSVGIVALAAAWIYTLRKTA